MARRSFSPLFGLGALLLTPLVALGCMADDWYDETEIQFEETTNIGYSCSQGAGFSWTVHARETGEQATAGCQQGIRFEDLRGGRTYTFDITGYLGQDVCWRGACTVRARSHDRTYADCSAQIQSYCGL